mmetsp:Transcript_60012/g.143280  ORF Transcript_60012/g.143280 Transcript_60012/m.143280 type:complete len:110 (-) Transcript_60012:2483-2812(-)
MRCTQTSTVVASIAGHSDNQTLTLKICNDVDLIIRLHPTEDNATLPELLQQKWLILQKMMPCGAAEGKLTLTRLDLDGVTSALLLGLALAFHVHILGVLPNKLVILNRS